MTVVHQTIEVRASPELAFEVFTDRITAWWPLGGFSYGGGRAREIHLEAHVGGRFYERFFDGDEMHIGDVVVCAPPDRIVFTWRAPGWDAPTEVHVTFTPIAAGTRVAIEHRGLAEIGPDGEGMAASFKGGWAVILGEYAARL